MGRERQKTKLCGPSIGSTTEPDLAPRSRRSTIDVFHKNFYISCKVLIMAVNQLVDSERQKVNKKAFAENAKKKS